ncbi:MAG: hypothetical protein AAF417_20025 [Pseudomonadota bacterium]
MPEITLLLLGLLLVMFGLGFVLGWILRGGRIRREKAAINVSWQDQMSAKKMEHERLAEQNKALMEQIGQYQASRKDSDLRAKELSDSLKETFEIRDELRGKLKEAKRTTDLAVAQRNKLKGELDSKIVQYDALSNALKDKDEKIFNLSRELESWQNRLPPLIERFRLRDLEAQEMEVELQKAQEQVAALGETSRSDETRIEPIETSPLAGGMDASNDQYEETSEYEAVETEQEDQPENEIATGGAARASSELEAWLEDVTGERIDEASNEDEPVDVAAPESETEDSDDPEDQFAANSPSPDAENSADADRASLTAAENSHDSDPNADIAGSTIDDIDASTIAAIDDSPIESIDTSAVEELDDAAINHVAEAVADDLGASPAEASESATNDDLEESAAAHEGAVVSEDIDDSAVEEIEISTTEELDEATIAELDASTIEEIEASMIDEIGLGAVDSADDEENESGNASVIALADHAGNASADLDDGIGADEKDTSGQLEALAADAGIEELLDEGTSSETYSDEATDDLQQIKGVGPAIEKTLHSLGIHRFQQIAEMSEYEIDRVARELRGFRSRIYREDWIGQAKMLQAEKREPVS